MSEKLQQLKALTEIRGIVEKHFPHEDFYYIECRLKEHIELEDYEEIEYDEGRGYVVKSMPYCKVCNATSDLTEVPTLKGSFYICDKCKKKIISADEDEDEDEDE